MTEINYFITLMSKYEFNLYMKLKTITRLKIKGLALVFLLILKTKFKIKLNKYLKMKRIWAFEKIYIEEKSLNEKDYKRIISSILRWNIFIIKSICINLA